MHENGPITNHILEAQIEERRYDIRASWINQNEESYYFIC